MDYKYVHAINGKHATCTVNMKDVPLSSCAQRICVASFNCEYSVCCRKLKLNSISVFCV